MSVWAKGSRTAGWWLAARVGLCVVAAYVGGRLDHGLLDGRSAYFALTMTVGMLVGLWAWGWRPKSHMGPLMFWWPALWLASELPGAFPDSRVASTIGRGPVRVRPDRLRPDGALVPDREAAPGSPGVDLRLHPRIRSTGRSRTSTRCSTGRAVPVLPTAECPTLLHMESAPPISFRPGTTGG